MVDYNIAIPQQQLFQAPDVMQNAMRMQQMQAQDMQMQQAQRAQQQQNAMAAHLGGGGDMSTPEFRQKLLAVGGASAAPLLASLATMEREKMQQRAEEARAGRYRSQSQVSDFDLQVNKRKDMLNRAPAAMASDEAWAKYYDDSVKEFGPNIALSPTRPSEKDLIGFLSSASDKIRQAEEQARAERDAGKLTPHVTDAGVLFTSPGGTYQVGRQMPPAGAPAAAGAPGAPAMPGAAPASAGFDMDRAKQAIAGIESGGKYDALGPVTNRGDRAFGKYQVMGANIPSWTKEALGSSMTPAEFLASPEAQERVFETQFGKSVAKYGNPADAASVWFSGRPLAKAGNASDVLGTTVPQYAQKFMAAYEGGANTPAMMRAPGFASSSGIPSNVGLPVAPVLNALAGPQPVQQGNALAAPMLQQQPAPVTTAQQPAPAPTNFEEMQRAANARNLEKQRSIETMKAQVASEAPPRAMTADQERRMLNTVSKDRLSAETTISTMDNVAKAVKDVQDLAPKQKESVTGLTAKLPPVFADSRTARTKLDNLKGVVTQMGKREASLGGAIGSMAVPEWKIVSDAIASLDTTNMNPKDLNDQLDIIAAKASAAAARIKDAYERQYEELKTKHGTRFDLSGGAAPAAAAKTSTELSVDDLLKKYAK